MEACAEPQGASATRDDKVDDAYTQVKNKKQKKEEKKARKSAERQLVEAKEKDASDSKVEKVKTPPKMAPGEARRDVVFGGGAVMKANEEKNKALNVAAKEFVAGTDATVVPKKGVSESSTPPGMPGLIESEDEFDIEGGVTFSSFVVKGVAKGAEKVESLVARSDSVGAAILPGLIEVQSSVPKVVQVASLVVPVVNAAPGLNANDANNIANAHQVLGEGAKGIVPEESKAGIVGASETLKGTIVDKVGVPGETDGVGEASVAQKPKSVEPVLAEEKKDASPVKPADPANGPNVDSCINAGGKSIVKGRGGKKPSHK
jgi:hypothetical protein